MAFLGLVLALFLLLGISFSLWAQLVFPLWVLLISVYILVANLGSPDSGTESPAESSDNAV